MSRFSVLPAVVCLLALSAHSSSDACFMRSPQPMHVSLDHIQVDVTDGVAVKTYNCTFKNPNPQMVVGATCYMELEPGAQIDDMSVWVDGKETKAEILDVQKAKEVFAEMVKNGHSPALLEYFGNQLIQTQVPKVNPGGTVTVKLRYTMALPSQGGQYRLQMLNTNPKALMQPLESASVTVNIKSRQPIKNLYSPTHEVKVVEREGWDVSAEWSQKDYLPRHPFVLYFQTADDEVGASLIAHRELDEEGTFMLLLSPTVGSGAGKISESDILPKDVVFCVDASGSMLVGGKMDQARAALKYCIEHLRLGDRFNVVDFGTSVRGLAEKGLLELNDENRTKALAYVEKLSARGGTAILPALEQSLLRLSEAKTGDDEGTAKGDRLQMILFATDGLPTIGEKDPDAILKAIDKANTSDVRLFVFGEGFDVNTKLLDFLALEHRGEADYILPEEKIQEKIARFFDRVGSPIMTDLLVDFEGLTVSDVLPARSIPDVFRGEQVVIYGRYTGHGKKTIRLTGNVGGKSQTFEYPLDFPEVSDDDRGSFVPRLWAGRKVDQLLAELRKQDPQQTDAKLVDEVTRLAKRYGIITPYTSYLMTNDVASASSPGVNEPQFGGQLLRQKLHAFGGAPAADAVDRAVQIREAKAGAEARRDFARGGIAGLDEQAEAEMQKAGRREPALAALRHIGTRTFYKRGAEWQDSGYESADSKDVTEVKLGSDDYFDLLMQDGRVAKYMALGDVVFESQGQWYRVVRP